MIRYPATEPFPTAWQREVAMGLETGQPPRLDLGFNQGGLSSIGRIVSLQAFVDERIDTTKPQILCGGDGSLWLLLLLMHQSDRAAEPATVLYTGAELVTHLASIATQHTAAAVDNSASVDALPASFATLLAPTFASGLTRWEAFPFVKIAPDAQAVGQNSASPTDPWLVWAAIAAALLLLFIPLLTLFV